MGREVGEGEEGNFKTSTTNNCNGGNDDVERLDIGEIERKGGGRPENETGKRGGRRERGEEIRA